MSFPVDHITVTCKVPGCGPIYNGDEYYALLGGKHPTCIKHAEARGWNRPRIAKEYPWMKLRKTMETSTDRLMYMSEDETGLAK